jgi:hypothetical protein
VIDYDIDQYCIRLRWALDAMSDQDNCLPLENLIKAINRAKGDPVVTEVAQEESLRIDAQWWANQISEWHATLAKETLTSPSGNVVVHPSGWVVPPRRPTWQEKIYDFICSVLLWEWRKN